MKIMIVDDNAAMRTLIRTTIARPQDEIHECDGGAEAVSLYDRLHPEVVLMDIQMRKVDGLTATQLIKASDPTATIIMVTNHDSQAFREAAYRSGASAFITKDDLSAIAQYMEVQTGKDSNSLQRKQS